MLSAGEAFVSFGQAPVIQKASTGRLSAQQGLLASAATVRPSKASSSSAFGLSAAALLTGAAVSAASTRRARRKCSSAVSVGGRKVHAVGRQAAVCAGVVITGGAAGVGYAYADEFISRGHQVVICDVKDPSVAVESLKAKHPNAAPGCIHGTVCDVSDLESINKLIEFAKEKIGTVHYWINNAGINGGRRRFTEIPTETIEAVVKVNLGGILMCTHAAMKMMENQAGVTGHVFNTVGSGVKGGGTPGYVAYGATKRGLPQMTDSLVTELEKGVQGYDKVETPGKVCCHTLSPGMVFTDLLLDDSTPELRKFPFGVLAAQPEEVAKDIVPKILSVNGNGKSVEFLTTDKILVKFFERFALGKKSEYIDDDGNVIKKPGAQYLDNGVRVLYDGMK
eukprot:TRINITY_DN4651_c1_g1_i1.p1 TRINITY_DN4651_c1_g1~~TRINITY_DN4651_c1_g1_i1.p1  ORF type:complete len:394 (+),score=100.36 TRINITY_DN4651_c1_g1_i1:66-1247(+)